MTMFGYTTLLKITVNEKGFDPLDLCLVRVAYMIVGTSIIALLMRADFYVAPKDRGILILRCIMGTIGFTSITFGVPLVPLVV